VTGDLLHSTRFEVWGDLPETDRAAEALLDDVSDAIDLALDAVARSLAEKFPTLSFRQVES
jgi:hypothetical protein